MVNISLFSVRVKISGWLWAVLLLSACGTAVEQKPLDYTAYHLEMIRASELMVAHRYGQALSVMEGVFGRYSFVFLRDYQVAAQLSVLIRDRPKAFRYLYLAVAGGWELPEIKKTKLLAALQSGPQWEVFLRGYPALRKGHLKGLDTGMRAELRGMFDGDQHLAGQNLKIQDEKAQEAFVMQQFVPQNQRQVKRILELTLKKGYPGEKKIGNGLWAWTILSHHNSVSPGYVKGDRLYPQLRPLLLRAIASGELSPGDFSEIEEWRIVVGSGHSESAYGYLRPLTKRDLARSDSLREAIGLPSVALRNQLVELQQRTGMNCFLAGGMWLEGKIPVLGD